MIVRKTKDHTENNKLRLKQSYVPSLGLYFSFNSAYNLYSFKYPILKDGPCNLKYEQNN